MKTFRRSKFLLTAGLLIVLASSLPAQLSAGEKMSFIENDQIRLGANLAIGGSITYLSTKTGPNMINSHDWGRQIQMSFYSGPKPFEPNGKKLNASWSQLGWNPIQSGDCYGNTSTLLEHRNDGQEIYIKSRPMHWPLNNVPGECDFECWFRLEGNIVHARSRLTNRRRDKTQYAGRTQELPAVYTNGKWYKLVSYQGDRPFSGAKPTVLVDQNDGKGWPWRNFYTPEHWVALLDKDDWGLGLYMPGACGFTGGFAGKPKGSGGPKSGQTGYMGTTIKEILDHNIVYTYDYTLIVGSLNEIRDYVYKCEKKRSLPRWEFKDDRQHWICQNVTDAGWPIKEGLRVALGSDKVALVSPKTFWRAEDAPTLSLRASFTISAKSAKILLQPYDCLTAGDWAQWGPGRSKRPKPAPPLTFPFKIKGDGKVRNLEIDLASHSKYRGGMTQIKLLLPTGKGTATLHAVELKGLGS